MKCSLANLGAGMPNCSFSLCDFLNSSAGSNSDQRFQFISISERKEISENKKGLLSWPKALEEINVPHPNLSP
jgi:hypothetical protein